MESTNPTPTQGEQADQIKGGEWELDEALDETEEEAAIPYVPLPDPLKQLPPASRDRIVARLAIALVVVIGLSTVGLIVGGSLGWFPAVCSGPNWIQMTASCRNRAEAIQSGINSRLYPTR